MSAAYIVWFRPHTMHSEEESQLLGIFTTRTLALETARKRSSHPDDEYSICEHYLNQEMGGYAIWDNGCDDPKKGRAWAEQFYARFWRNGFPFLKGE